MQNIQASPSSRSTRFSPSAGSQASSCLSTAPSAISGKHSATCTVQSRAIRPASVDSALRALVGSTAATRLPINGKRMSVIRGMRGWISGGMVDDFLV